MTAKTSRWTAIAAVIVSLLLLVASLCSPAFLFGPGNVYPGWFLFFFGWIGVFKMLSGEFDALSWCANPCLVVAIILLLNREYRAAMIASVVTCGFAACSFLLKEINLGTSSSKAAIIGHGAGFYLWLAAIATCCGAAVILSAMSPPKERRERGRRLRETR